MDTQARAAQAPLPGELAALLAASDEAGFERALAELIRAREGALFRALGQVARQMHEAIKRLAREVPVDTSAGGMPDARRQLDEALAISERAANAHLDLGERLLPAAIRLESRALELHALAQAHAGAPLAAPALALAAEASAFAGSSREGLRELVEAQSWQDLSGQRMRRVGAFLDHVDQSLLELVRLVGAATGAVRTDAAEALAAPARLSAQEQVDQLLTEFGF